MNFEQERQRRLDEIEGILDKFLPKEEGYQSIVMKAMNYSVLAGGKRLRPMLMGETFRLFDGKDQKLLEPFMAAIEMIHTYSLVHDDLPAMDNDDYRRGRKTTHVVFGEAIAILAGDGLLNYAFETASKAFSLIDGNNDLEELHKYRKVSKSLEILANKAGIYGMIGGQTVDVMEFNGIMDKERLDFIYKLKTSALVEASMMIGAILAGATEGEIKTVEQIAGDIGLAFQIRDDILDVIGTEEALGKPVHSDEKNDKATYVSVLGIDKAMDEVEFISQRAIKAFETLNHNNEYLKLLIFKLINRES
jgi:geranylgeranyl diphosphate synthase type II